MNLIITYFAAQFLEKGWNFHLCLCDGFYVISRLILIMILVYNSKTCSCSYGLFSDVLTRDIFCCSTQRAVKGRSRSSSVGVNIERVALVRARLIRTRSDKHWSKTKSNDLSQSSKHTELVSKERIKNCMDARMQCAYMHARSTAWDDVSMWTLGFTELWKAWPLGSNIPQQLVK